MQFALENLERIDKIILVNPAGMLNPLPLMGRIANLPGVGELVYGLWGNFMRKLALRKNFIHDLAYITETYFKNVTRFHKIKGTSQAMLTILRKRFFDTLLNEIEEFGKKNAPILIVWECEDKAIPVERGIAMQRILDGSRLEILDYAGHCPHNEKSAQFNQLAIEFLTGTNEVISPPQ